MEDRRRHKRLRLDLLEINGKMSLAEKVEIEDIGLGGVSLRADRRLNIGKEILLKLDDRETSLEVKCVVVRSQVSGIVDRANGEKAMVYQVGLIFKDGQSDAVAGFLSSFEQHKKQKEQLPIERRLTIRFSITAPQEKTLAFPAQFRVKVISVAGMLIECEQPLALDSIVPMVLSMNAHKNIELTGRVASCKMSDNKKQMTYDIGVEFQDLTNEDKALIEKLMEYFSKL